jgi:hypothetical protein
VDANGPESQSISESLPTDLLGRLATLYPKLAPVEKSDDAVLADFGAPTLEMPEMDALGTRVSRCAFEVFDEPAQFAANARAKAFVTWSAPRNDAYRVYFDPQSNQVYVDLNGKRWNEIRAKLEEETLYCEILRSLIWVVTCEVELAEAREAEKAAAETVTADVVEVVIP